MYIVHVAYIGQFFEGSHIIMTLLIFWALTCYYHASSAFEESEVDGFYLDISSSGPIKQSKK